MAHAPAGGNRGDQLVVGAHGETSKKTKPRKEGPAGVLSPEGAPPSERNRKALSAGENRLDYVGEFHDACNYLQPGGKWQGWTPHGVGPKAHETTHRNSDTGRFPAQSVLLQVLTQPIGIIDHGALRA